MNGASSQFRVHIQLRVYGVDISDALLSHGYCLDDYPSGISHVVDKWEMDVRTMTLKNFRSILMFDKTGQFNRRSRTFSEVLYIFSRLPNVFNRPKEQLTSYLFGFINKQDKSVSFIPKHRETVPIAELISATDIFLNDLALVPLSQLSPENEALLLADPNEPKPEDIQKDNEEK